MDEGVATTAAAHSAVARHEPGHRSAASTALPNGVVLALPTTTTAQHGPVAGWVSTAGWASALRRVIGAAWIATPEGILDEHAARARASRPELAPPPRTARSRLPVLVKTAVKDVREFRRARAFHIPTGGPWDGHAVEFVWQRHELFHRAGLDLARRLGVPAVSFVPAPLVWQASEWGVRRPGWSRQLERVEAAQLRSATLIAAGTDTVAAHLTRMGVPESRIVVTPTGIDIDVFDATAGGAEARRATRRELGVDGSVVVGWVGSFRRFHALDLAVDALARSADTSSTAAAAGAAGSAGPARSTRPSRRERVTLLLVGDGPERARVEARARAAGIRVVATGTVAHDRMPALMRAMDIALVLAERGKPFHYSPLKLSEYLAAGVAVVAPDAGEIPMRFRAPAELLLFTPGDVASLRDRIDELIGDPELRNRLAATGPGVARARATWDRSVERIVSALDARSAAVVGSR